MRGKAQPYREPVALEPLTEEDAMEDMRMDDNTKEVRITRAVVGGIAMVLLCITAACLYGNVDSHRADIEIARYAAERAREDAARAMWDHMQCVPSLPSEKKP